MRLGHPIAIALMLTQGLLPMTGTAQTGLVPRLEFDAPSTLNQFMLVSGGNLISPVNENYSSTALLEDTGEVLVLLNRGTFWGQPPRIHVFTPAGAYLRTISMQGFDDPEGICQLRTGSNRYAIVEEGENDNISLVTISTATTNIDKSVADVYPVALPFGKIFNKGMEGVTYDAPNDRFYVVQEAYPMGVYRITLNETDTTTEVAFDAEQVFSDVASDLSDLTYSPYTERLFVLSDTGKIVVECTTNGIIIDTLSVPALQPEGLVFYDDGRTLLTVSEPNQAFQFTRGPTTTTSMEGTNATVTLRLSQPLTSTTTVDFSVSGVGVDPGLDFEVPDENTVEFLPGMTTTSITVRILTDTVSPEMDESIAIVMSNVIGDAILGPQFDHVHVIKGDPFELVVHSDYGDPFPPVGTNFFSFGHTLTCYVPNSPVEFSGATQYVCQGWYGTNSLPLSGSTSNTGPFALMTNSSITWRWSTNFWLGALAKPTDGGVVTGANRWIPLQDNVTMSALTNTYYAFSSWSGDVGPAGTNAQQLTVSMTAPRQVTACFIPLLATNDVPLWWIALHYGATNDFDALALSDSDQDSMMAWEEYIADTDPTDPSDKLSILSVDFFSNQYIVTWRGSPQRLYTLYRTTNLTLFPDGNTVAIDIPGNPTPETVVFDPAPPPRTGHYWIEVNLPGNTLP